MSKKSKRKKNKALPNPDQHGTQQNLPSANVRVRGEIEVGRSPSLTDEHNTERREDTAHESNKYLVEILTLIAVAIYAVVAIWQGISAHRSAIAARDAANVARDTLVASERPWVGISGSGNGNFQLEIAENRPLSVTLYAQNVGKTPALNEIGVNKLTIVPRGNRIPDFGGYSKSEAGPPAVLFPGAIATLHNDTSQPDAAGNSKPPLTLQQVEEFKSGAVQLYVYGSIWYDDTFHTREHRTDYCFVYIPDLSKTIANFSACKTHNYAD